MIEATPSRNDGHVMQLHGPRIASMGRGVEGDG